MGNIRGGHRWIATLPCASKQREPMAGDDRPLRHRLIHPCQSGNSTMNQEHSIALCSPAQGDLLKNLCARVPGAAALALILAVASGGGVRAPTVPFSVPAKSFPESVTSPCDVTL